MLKIALPKGELQEQTASLLREQGLEIAGYHGKSRAYTAVHKGISCRAFREKDISIQVSVGNYDLGICGEDWVEELVARHAGAELITVADLGVPKGKVFMAASSQQGVQNMEQLVGAMGTKAIRVVSQYPHLAESYALRQRIPRFRVFPVWGASEAYPPEAAEAAVLLGRSRRELLRKGLIALDILLDASLVVIANRLSFQHKDLSPFLDRIMPETMPSPHARRAS